MKRNLLFLDIDGVMNSKSSCMSVFNKKVKKQYESRGMAPRWIAYQIETPAKKHIKCLNYILDNTDTDIIISSMWREDFSLIGWNYYLCSLGVRGNVEGMTPRLSATRGYEIAKFLENKEYNNFVILDDDYDYEHEWLKPNWVLCDNAKGLTMKEAEEAIEILNKGN